MKYLVKYNENFIKGDRIIHRDFGEGTVLFDGEVNIAVKFDCIDDEIKLNKKISDIKKIDDLGLYNTNIFSVGDIVYHTYFGKGIVKSFDENKNFVTVKFLEYGLKTFFIKVLNLKGNAMKLYKMIEPEDDNQFEDDFDDLNEEYELDPWDLEYYERQLELQKKLEIGDIVEIIDIEKSGNLEEDTFLLNELGTVRNKFNNGNIEIYLHNWKKFEKLIDWNRPKENHCITVCPEGVIKYNEIEDDSQFEEGFDDDLNERLISNFNNFLNESVFPGDKDEHIFKAGDKVIFTDCVGDNEEKYGSINELLWARKYLKKGNIYTVLYVDLQDQFNIVLHIGGWNYNAYQFKKYEEDEDDDSQFEDDFEDDLNESVKLNYDTKEFDDEVIKLAQYLINKFSYLVPKKETKTIVKDGVIDLEFIKKKVKDAYLKRNESWHDVGWTIWYALLIGLNGFSGWLVLKNILRRLTGISKFMKINNYVFVFVNAFAVFLNASIYFNKVTTVDKSIIVATKYEDGVIYVKDIESNKYDEWKINDDFVKKNKKPGDTVQLKDVDWFKRKINYVK